jgi:cytochrome c-type biogenesis protein CcmH/NrfF
MDVSGMPAMHLGTLHPVETLVMALLALAPFVILAVVVTVVSRRDRRAEAAQSVTPPEQRDFRDR